MGVLLRLWAVFVVAIKRLFAQRGLTLATIAGLVAAIAFTMSVPLYSDAVYYRMLRTGLFGSAQEAEERSRPPFAYMFRYVGSWHGPVEWADVEAVDQYLSGAAGAELGLPRQALVRYFKTDNLQLFPKEDVAYASTKDPLSWNAIGFISDLQDHVEVVEGSFPAAVNSDSPDSPVEVLVSQDLASKLGLQVGETYYAFAPRVKGVADTPTIPVKIAGIWTAKDPNEDYWFYKPTALDQELLVPEATFLQRISPTLVNEVYLALWYLLMDGSNVSQDDVGSLLGRAIAVQQRVSALLPETDLAISPVEALAKYQRSARLLTILLYAFSVPIIGLLLAFIGLVGGLSVGRRRNEIAVLRSRGATGIQVVGMATLEALFLGLLALLLAWPASKWIASVIGRTTSFLNFTAPADLRVSMTPATLRVGLIAVGLTVIAQLIPTIEAARHTIVTYKQERARSLRRPWWQRAWLDLLLLIPAVYGAYLLRKQGSVVVPVGGNIFGSDPFQNPLLFLVPALGIFALTLLILRLLPAVMAAFAWLSSKFSGVGTLLAARHLSRTPGSYSAPLILLVLTLSLSAFTASLAQTLDNHLYDQTYYQVGSDMRLVELGEDTEAASSYSFSAGGQAASEAQGSTAANEEESSGPRWQFLPVSEHLKVAGVQAAARIGEFGATTRLSGGLQEGTFLGVDRVDFPRVAFWRSDFAPSRLGALMNSLAIAPEGVLMPRSFMARHALKVGDNVRITVNVDGQQIDLDMKVAGGFDLWPGWYPEDGPLFVGDLGYLFEQAGGEYPYSVWLKTDATTATAKIVNGVRELRLRVLDADSAPDDVRTEQRRPERQGLFGLLSIGFAAAALLTVVGFLLYALFSFRRRFIELGILRAIGLSSGQMGAFLAWELLFLIATGLVAGTVLGAWVSNLFIPYLQVGQGPEAKIPPFLVEIAWPAIFRIYFLFGLLFLIALGVLIMLLRRMRIFQAVKLGETA